MMMKTEFAPVFFYFFLWLNISIWDQKKRKIIRKIIKLSFYSLKELCFEKKKMILHSLLDIITHQTLTRNKHGTLFLGHHLSSRKYTK